ncbi:hypothetical protein SSX86_022171 [Deinandra increscens subsp. villosa]|uniref:Protein TIFY n=1 Tax=Deinandra increscens subsp. villosa TaxID=3103831 RepID=A0AAP0CJU8_9ASTR
MGWQVAGFPLANDLQKNCPLLKPHAPAKLSQKLKRQIHPLLSSPPNSLSLHNYEIPQILKFLKFPKFNLCFRLIRSVFVEIATMSTEEPPSASASAVSVLEKPLHQLTEDDISQLTREDCRRYLKQKGMRRPSWNKSQAIQQVIMLKALLEPSPESDDRSRNRKLYITSRQQQQTPATRVQKGTSADTEISLSAEESVPGHRSNDTEKSDFLGDNDTYNDSAPPGIVGGTEETKGQMTIFYSGMVNVYDDVPADKAQTLFQLAASPLQFSQENPFDGSMLQPTNINVGRDFSPVLSPVLQTVRMTDSYRLPREESNTSREDNTAEGSASRKASVQRYLEKRKDRFKSKRKAGATFDIYANHQIRNHNNLHEQLSRSGTCSPPPVRPPNTPTRFS